MIYAFVIHLLCTYACVCRMSKPVNSHNSDQWDSMLYLDAHMAEKGCLAVQRASLKNCQCPLATRWASQKGGRHSQKNKKKFSDRQRPTTIDIPVYILYSPNAAEYVKQSSWSNWCLGYRIWSLASCSEYCSYPDGALNFKHKDRGCDISIVTIATNMEKN